MKIAREGASFVKEKVTLKKEGTLVALLCFKFFVQDCRYYKTLDSTITKNNNMVNVAMLHTIVKLKKN